ncbi:MAG: type VI secretion system baseplate subunit TssG [Chitinispirillia bacterium]|nr:type VI secretion system baseplate subunit TssG [Chitinispirillia bacterium]
MNNIINILTDEFYSFDIDQLVDIINEIFGGSGRIFFEAGPSLSFPSSDISSVCIDNDNKLASVTLPVMNLLGISSPLPVKFSDYIARNRQDAGFYRDFLSIVQNRLHCLWLDARRKYAFWGGAADRVRAILESMPVRSSCGLKLLIRSEWGGIPAAIEENVERRASVDNARALGRGLLLGQNAAAGTRVRDRASKFRVSLGPLDYDMYRSFLPGEDNCLRLQKIVTSYLNAPLICELEISCRKGDLPRAQIGGPRKGCLGRTLLLGRPPEDEVHRYRVELDKKT